jgi:branched-chain amino acid transport system permease protein
MLLPFLLRSGFMLSMASAMGIMIIFALSYNMLLGQGGMLSFGHAVYFGLGGLFFGIIFGYVSTRRAGTPFALISLAAFFAGIADGLFDINYEIVTAEVVGAIPSANVLMMTYIGGTGLKALLGIYQLTIPCARNG